MAGGAGQPVDDLPGWARELLAGARVGHLGLIDDRDRPRVLPIAFALHEGTLYSAIDSKPKRTEARNLARVRYLLRRPQASLTVDRYEDDDWSALAWVQAIGRVEIVEVEENPPALGALEAKYAPYRAQSPPGPLLVLTPERTVCWRAG